MIPSGDGGWSGWTGRRGYSGVSGMEMAGRGITSTNAAEEDPEQKCGRKCKKAARCCTVTTAVLAGVAGLSLAALAARSATRPSSVLTPACNGTNATDWVPINANATNCTCNATLIEPISTLPPPMPTSASFTPTSFGTAAPNITQSVTQNHNPNSTTARPTTNVRTTTARSTTTPVTPTVPAILQMPKLLSEHEPGGYMRAMNTTVASLWDCRHEMNITTADCVKIHAVKLTQPGNKCGVMLLQGRAEDTGRYQETARDFSCSGCDFYTYDHRGQGLSDRLLKDPQVGYVGAFQDYVDDLNTVLNATGFFHQGYNQTFIIGHSTGGAVAALWAEQNQNCTVDGLILSSPMMGLPMGAMTKAAIRGMTSFLGQGVTNKEGYAPGKGPYVKLGYSPDTSRGSLSAARYNWTREHIDKHPDAMIGGPSLWWVRQALDGSASVVTGASNITAPVLLLQAGDEMIVSNSAQDNFFKKLVPPICGNGMRNHTMVTIQGGRHELFGDSDGPRNTTMRAIFNFMNGKPQESAAMQEVYAYEAQQSQVGSSARRARRDAHGSTKKHGKR